MDFVLRLDLSDDEEFASITSEEDQLVDQFMEEKEDEVDLMPAPMTSVVFKSEAQKSKEKKRTGFRNPRNDSDWSVAFSFLTVSDRDLFLTDKCAGMKSFSCQYCGVETKSFEEFKAHLALLHMVMFNSYRCWECPKLFDSVKSLLSHLFYKHMGESFDLKDSSEANQYKQISLFLSFKWFEAVDENRNLDTAPDYVCPFCLKNFGSFNAMERHVMKRGYAKGHYSQYNWFKGWQFSG